MSLLIEQLLNGLAAGAMYALITLGLALIYGVMKILHVAHASVYTAGAYMGLCLYTHTGSMLVAAAGSMVFCAVLGVLIEKYIYFPLLKFPPYVPLISSIALMIAIEELCRLVAGPEVRTFPANLPFPSFTVGGVTVSPTLTAVYVVSAVVLALLWLLMKPLNALVTRLPLISTVNGLGGAALGLVCGGLTLFVAVWAMQRFGWLLTPELIDGTTLLKFFATQTPLGLLAAL